MAQISDPAERMNEQTLGSTLGYFEITPPQLYVYDGAILPS
jgi:hypothetical protein